MDNNELMEEIKDKNVDVEYFANEVIKDKNLRNLLVKQMITNKDIMVYYHCYYILDMATELRPELFIEHWNNFTSLINHKNSYHRSIGLTMIANLVCVDGNHQLDNILEDYFEHIDDEKFMTAQCCLKNIGKIVMIRKDLRKRIIEMLLKVDEICSYHEKQRELLKYDILVVMDLIYQESDIQDQERMNIFIDRASNSISNKTKKKAIELIRKYLCQ